MKSVISFITILCLFTVSAFSQQVFDDFEGNGTINSWYGDNCGVNPSLENPHSGGINTSNTVLDYHDTGGQYANVRFDIPVKFDLSENHTFTLKIYVPSNQLTGNQNNQISLKLQNSDLGEPWTTQCEIIKDINTDTWQTVSFDFLNDDFVNFNPNSDDPTTRSDFNRVLFQVNGENNNDQVRAYIDDFEYDGTIDLGSEPNFNVLVWSDECDGNGAIDTDKWFHQTILPNGFAWFNGELQHYTDRTDNAFLADGYMTIRAKKETYTNQGQTKDYTSARLNSKFAFKYGKVDIRAKLPEGAGTWPAFWMLGKNITENGAYWEQLGFGTTAWPACGEIDIMEHWGTNQNYVQSATHTPSSFGNTVNHGGQVIPTASSDFHVYTLEWTEEKLRFLVDGNLHFTYNPSDKNADTWPFDDEMYILINTAIQSSISPGFTYSDMVIDYIRVYEEGPVSTSKVDLLDKDLEYYPNPVVDALNIVVGQSVDAIEFKIYNHAGAQLSEGIRQPVDGILTIDQLNDLEDGYYLLNMKIENRNTAIKFFKF
jgi:beta-glucanase (GH16 family)